MKIINQQKQLAILFLIGPIGWLLSFFLEQFNIGSFNSYFSLVSLFLLFYLVATVKKTNFILVLLLFSYFVFNILNFEKSIIKSSRESVEYILAISAFLLIPQIKINRDLVQKPNTKKYFSYFVAIFTIAYIITALIAGPRINNDEEITRVYYDGFIISHSFSYYSILFSVLLYKFNRKYFAAIILILAFIVGNRSAIIVLFFAIGILIEMYSKTKFTSTILYIISISILVCFVLVSYNIIIGDLKLGELQKVLLNPENNKFTSGRTVLWYNALDNFILNGSTFEIFFGKGPDSIENLSWRLYRNTLWAHNDFIQILFTFGLFGLICYLGSALYLAHYTGIYSIFMFVIVIGFLNGFYKYGALQLIIILYSIQTYSTSKKPGPKKYLNYK